MWTWDTTDRWIWLVSFVQFPWICLDFYLLKSVHNRRCFAANLFSETNCISDSFVTWYIVTIATCRDVYFVCNLHWLLSCLWYLILLCVTHMSCGIRNVTLELLKTLFDSFVKYCSCSCEYRCCAAGWLSIQHTRLWLDRQWLHWWRSEGSSQSARPVSVVDWACRWWATWTSSGLREFIVLTAFHYCDILCFVCYVFIETLDMCGAGHPPFHPCPFTSSSFAFLLFAFFHWLYLFSSFVHPFSFYQNSPTPFQGRKS